MDDADCAVKNEPAHLAVDIRGAQMMVDTKRHACGLASLCHLDCVIRPNGNRFVTQNVLSCRGSREDLLAVVSIRGADVDRLQCVVCEHLFDPTGVPRHATRIRQ
jgi:hypothetical protein